MSTTSEERLSGAPPVVDVRLRRKVHDGVDLLLLQDVHHQVGRLDVALDEPAARRDPAGGCSAVLRGSA